MTANSGGFIRANGIDIHYVQAGQGVPLILLHGGLVSTNPIWAPTPVSYAGHMETLARRYRVIAPDTRSCGRTVHDGGVVTFGQLADDVLALADALDLDRPLIAGFSEGGITATIAGIRYPDRFGAIVNDAGYDAFNPQAPSAAMMRQMLGGSPAATLVWPAVRAEHLTVHELSETTADATEGTPAGIGINWERCHYDWSQPDRVTATVTSSNVYADPGSSWQLTATPSKHGSRVEMVWQRTFRRNPRGLFFGTLFRIVGRPIFGHYARQVIANLEALERNPSPHQMARRPSGTQSADQGC